ncbi:membrane protein [Leclercia adecarboxylata]|nr:membrane protein [Leclercia adecarboxylata]KMN61145.1 membrane protein [Leclercia sp. LK8]
MLRYGFLVASLCFASYAIADTAKYKTVIEVGSEKKIDEVIEALPDTKANLQDLIVLVSSKFLQTPYKNKTLIGSQSIPEQLVINLKGVDCLTLLDYVQALAKSNSREEFIQQLVNTRYIDGNVSYLTRRHFLSDWFAMSPQNAEDVTPYISEKYLTAEKHLNLKPEGGEYVPGLGIIKRKINYIPGYAIDSSVLESLHNGDYVGVYSPMQGLDVSHTGIVIRAHGTVFFRNASSLPENGKVVDTPFLDYMQSKPGIVVLRAK